MGIYSSKMKSLLEVERTVNGKTEDLSKTEDDENTPDPNDGEHDSDTTPGNDYTANNDENNDNNEEDNNSEEDPDNQEGNNEDDDHNPDTEPGTDYTANDDNNEENNDTDQNDDNQNNDYTIPNDDENNNEDDNTGDDPDTEEDPDASQEGSPSELQDLENELFKDLTQPQITIKVNELRTQYLETYNAVINIINRLNTVSKTSENIKVLEFVVNKLIELKDMIYYYLTNTFDTQTYIQNSINYEEYLATLNTINKILDQLKIKDDAKKS